ncbi:tRNA uridine-5-carboxymethylaminomethyl(34) synthesis GTPase MnmE [Rhizosaccharibacter radicis]|uniref:tRNA modification GTPase MnmE n=1 Tax=Rhizosaccharibacter radicis TaxID=2782605 RepID=A0ABT1VSU3_9PROT|nr:tRNA uridine-5-carboxymethylaminomethyl(34) synthesis GTPase MnmE [Acetobacteraceae bacterium KSS12]
MIPHHPSVAAAEPTIFARATGTGRAAIAVIRLSGATTGAILDCLCGHSRPPPRRAVLRALRAPTGSGAGPHEHPGAGLGPDAGELLDRALVLWFPGPHSYTGEDAAELHLHAGPAVVEAVGDALVALGARPAEPGEFTRRAFRNGRLDLLEAEGIADLIEAETQAQRRQALRQQDGALSRLYAGWADRLRVMLAAAEALIDFPDEDLPPDEDALIRAEIRMLGEAMRAHLRDGAGAERLRTGLFFAVAGPPNAGKSTLVNLLCGRDAAIVSPWAGTTRDALEVRLVLGDVPVTLVDTAGLRDTDDPVEAEGVRRARAHADAADVVIRVADGADASAAPGAVAGGGSDGPVSATTGLDETGSDGTRSGAATTLPVWNKCDLQPAPPGWLGVSALTGENVETLRDVLAAEARRLTASGAAPPPTRARHRAGIAEAAARLEDAAREELPELRGEALRLAMDALGRLTGRIGVEDLLDTVFNRFCIGK